MIKKIGLQTFTIRKDIKTVSGLENELRHYVSLGIKSFELSRIKFNSEEMEVLKMLKDELGIKYIASQITLGKIKSDFDFMMEFSKKLDIKYLEVSVIPLKNFLKGKEGIKALGRELDKIGKRTKEHGISLLFHHHNFELIKFENKISLDLLIDETDSKLVNFICDTYWIAKSGYNPAKFIADRLSRVRGVHLRDNHFYFKTGKFSSTDTTIGQGTIDFESITALDKQGLIEFYSIEQDTDNPKKDIKQGYDYLKNIIETSN